jgi:hypothetical protein
MALRAVSTVLDVTLCLLLIGAAVATLTVPGGQPPHSTADETVEQVATATANVTDPPSSGDGNRRIVAGTQAELLARAAVANLSLDGSGLTPSTRPFRVAVRNRVRRTLSWSARSTSVAARWAPYSGAPLHGRIVVGPAPPPGVSIRTATLSVPVPMETPLEDEPQDPATFRAVARSVSVTVLETTLSSARGGGAAAESTRQRGRRRAFATALGAVDPTSVNRSELRDRLMNRLASDMRRRFDSPDAAASALDSETAEIVVREWST